jgi:hypothetical protein
MARVSLCAALWAQVLVCSPSTVSVGALVCAQLPQLCAPGLTATGLDWVCDELKTQTRVSVPALMQVGAVVTVGAPHSWSQPAPVSFSQAAYISAPAASTHRMCFAFMGNSFICL